jgi:hypothetical protein
MIHKSKLPQALTVYVALSLIWFAIPFLDGCSTYRSARRTTKKLARNVVPFGDSLRKSIGIIRFENWSFYKQDSIEQVFQKKISQILVSACPQLLLAKPEDENYPEFLAELPPRVADRIDNLNLALLGRQHGFDAIATGAIVDISAFEENRGVLWFRDIHSFIQIQILVEVFDTETGAKLLNENFIHEFEVDETDYEFIRDKKPTNIIELTENIENIAVTLGEKMCDAISDQPWKSYVISKDGRGVIISSGARAGLEKGMMLKVYDAGKVIKGVENERFFLPGPEIGEIRITQTHPDHAEAETTQDNGIQVGGTVRLD